MTTLLMTTWRTALLFPSQNLMALDDEESRQGVDGSSWWRHARPRRREGLPNPEARWYVRIAGDGTVDSAQTIGFRVDDDADIVVEAAFIEKALVEMVDRASLALGTIWPGAPALISASISGSEDLLIAGAGTNSRRGYHYGIHLGFHRVVGLGRSVGDQLRPMMDKLWLEAGRALGAPSFPDGLWSGYL